MGETLCGEKALARIDGRANDEPRKAIITPGFLEFAEGSALIELGKTRVLCAASIEERVPPFLRGRGKGWLTAEYSMLPRSTLTRTPRESALGGRSQEIQRLVGRCLRAVTDLAALGERSVIIDCDVLQADGGTRTAAITGGYVALYQALRTLMRNGVLAEMPLRGAVAAISAGIVGGEALLDLCYEEDSRAQVDFNIAVTSKGELVEVQGGAEGLPFSRDVMLALLALADRGTSYLFRVQAQATASL